jgi:hypothetical protein
MLLNFATACSLVLCLSAIVLWVRSYRGALSLPTRLPLGKPVDSARYVNVGWGSWLEASSNGGRLYFLRFANFEITDHGPDSRSSAGSSAGSAAGRRPTDSKGFAMPDHRYSLAWRGRRHGWIARGKDAGWRSVSYCAVTVDRDLRVFRWQRGHLPTPFWNRTGPPQPEPPPPLRQELLPQFQLLTVPHWFAATILGFLPTARTAGFVGAWSRSGRRRRVGRCGHCGYDLRATPERCPECGAVCSSVVDRVSL